MPEKRLKKLKSYTAPLWAGKLSYIPSHRVDLIMTPTPIEDWSLPDVDQQKYNLMIKRDDLTGCALTGSKIRKFEFQFADAIQKGYKGIVLSGGGFQSNHCRAGSVASVQLGLKCHIVIQSYGQSELPNDGNMFLNVLCGASIKVIEEDSPEDVEDMTRIARLVRERVQEIKLETGEDLYDMYGPPIDKISVWGYIEAFEEILQQAGDTVDDIVAPCATCGLSAGLAVANYLAGSPYRIHTICTYFDKLTAERTIDKILSDLGLTDITTEQVVTIHDQYMGLGYAKNSQQEQEFLCKVAQTTGIILDACYGVKASYGLRDLLMNKPECFKGTNILYIHTGGLTAIQASPIREELFKTALRVKNEK